MDNLISVLTIVHGRKPALINLISGLANNTDLQLELVVVHMNESVVDLPANTFPIRSISCNTAAKLPLAMARNLAVAHAASEFCIFLDVDCIPAANFIHLYRTAFATSDQLWSGQVRYLQHGFPEDADTAVLQKWSTADPVRAGLTSLPYELFWSLNFACSKTVFAQINGFDESYTGYGAEDTDFSFEARNQGITLGLLPAMAYHQPHPSYDPPLNHLTDIVNNASVFYHKWQRWPMEGWLRQFKELGFISWTADSLSVLHLPSPSIIAQHQKS